MSENWKKSKGSDNLILNTIGNICGWVSHIFLKPNIRWGTMWEYKFDLEEDIDKDEYDVDEVW
jgi:hypothetical protein